MKKLITILAVTTLSSCSPLSKMIKNTTATKQMLTSLASSTIKEVKAEYFYFKGKNVYKIVVQVGGSTISLYWNYYKKEGESKFRNHYMHSLNLEDITKLELSDAEEALNNINKAVLGKGVSQFQADVTKIVLQMLTDLKSGKEYQKLSPGSKLKPL